VGELCRFTHSLHYSFWCFRIKIEFILVLFRSTSFDASPPGNSTSRSTTSPQAKVTGLNIGCSATKSTRLAVLTKSTWSRVLCSSMTTKPTGSSRVLCSKWYGGRNTSRLCSTKRGSRVKTRSVTCSERLCGSSRCRRTKSVTKWLLSRDRR